MTIAEIKTGLSAERIALVRVTAARNLGADLLPLGGGVYGATYDSRYIFFHVYRNGTLLTRDTSAPTVNNHWYYDEDTSTFQIKLAGAPDNTTNVVIGNFLFYLTNGVSRDLIDPEIGTTTRRWDPLLKVPPSVSVGINNQLVGIFTIQAAPISIIDAAGSMREFFIDSDTTFYRQQVKIWYALDDFTDPDNQQLVYDGLTVSASIRGSDITLNTVDNFEKLDQPALMGDTQDEAYWFRSANSFPDLDARKNGKPIPMILGKWSRWSVEPDFLSNGENLDYKYMYEAALTSYTSTLSTSDNREWGLCRTRNGFRSQVYGAINAVSGAGPSTLRSITYLQAVWDTMDVEIGDTVRLQEGAVDEYARVVIIQQLTGPDRVSVSFLTDNAVVFTAAVTITGNAGPSVVITDGTEKYFLRHGRDFTVSSTATSGGNDYHYITLVNNFEANFSGLTMLDPSKHQVFYRARVDYSDSTHADIVEALCSSAGMSTDATTFAAAESDLNVNVRFSIPYFDESDFRSYRDYIADIASSAMSVVYPNNDFEVAYSVLEVPDTAEFDVDQFIYLGSDSIDIEYQDIVTRIDAYNPHIFDRFSIDDTDTSAASAENPASSYLNDIDNPVRFRHVLETITDRIDAMIDIKSVRRAIYTFVTSMINIDSEIYDSITILPRLNEQAGLTATPVRITQLDKGVHSTTVKATDLVGL